MIEVSTKWITTPANCHTCGHNMQAVFESDVIKDGDTIETKLPKDFKCTQCGSNDIVFTDFVTKN